MCCDLLPQVAGMSSEAFAASRDFSSLLGQLMQAASAPADDTLAWLQREYWKHYYASTEAAEKKAAEKKAAEQRSGSGVVGNALKIMRSLRD
jgi:hypothetical protein